MADHVYRLTVWGEDMGPEVFRTLTEFARTIAGDAVKVEVVDIPLTDEPPEFERETFGYVVREQQVTDATTGGGAAGA